MKKLVKTVANSTENVIATSAKTIECGLGVINTGLNITNTAMQSWENDVNSWAKRKEAVRSRVERQDYKELLIELAERDKELNERAKQAGIKDIETQITELLK